MHAELGKSDQKGINQAISASLQNSAEFILIGGPPCQAYSIAGRSRNKGNAAYEPDKDHRQYLYKEYLQVIADHTPALFVMENVKGLLSATINNELVFNRIIEDLGYPSRALVRDGRVSSRSRSRKGSAQYNIYSFVASASSNPQSLMDFVVRMEKHGVPQTRHRLVLLGVRKDLGNITPIGLKETASVPVSQILEGLPRLRSGLSQEKNNNEHWIKLLGTIEHYRWLKSSKKKAGSKVCRQLLEVAENIRPPTEGQGDEFIRCTPTIAYRPDWFLDKRIGGICNHSSRSHMRNDLFRYLYASCFAKVHGRTPMMRDFPTDLLPDHASVVNALDGGFFEDRFRVQISHSPATTITSHIAKDGHYYIHPDPFQCRSLTVREAARLQTFPDNYYFIGGRTAQYIQVGNAVPPLLAVQIAEIVFSIMKKIGFA